jgi:hypothetical protein
LHLDLDEPVRGWLQYFAERDIEVVEDVCGRPSVPRWVLTKLLDEEREREARVVQEAAERAARETAPVAVGVPALSESASAYETLLAPEAISPVEEFGLAPKPNFVAEQIEAGQRHRLAEREAARRKKERAT